MIRKHYFCKNCCWSIELGRVFWGLVDLEDAPQQQEVQLSCSECGRGFDFVELPEDKKLCPECGEVLDVLRREVAPDGTFMIGGDDYSKPLISDSLAINPEQITEHREAFPDVKVHPDGRPEFADYRQHDDYLKKTGFRKVRQKVKPKGKIIARTK